jgi:hypothetical protein
MFAAKLQENYDEDIDMEEGMMDDIPTEGATQEEYADRGNRMEEIDLDEILAELDSELNEAKGDDDEEVIDAEEDVEDIEDDAKEDKKEKKEVKDLDFDELEQMIIDIIAQETGGTGDGEGYEDAAGVDAMDMAGDAEMPEDENLEEDLDALLAELLGEGKKKVAEKEVKKVVKKEEDDEKKKIEEDLKEAVKTVEILRSELNEVNLLNAKLLYVNKIFNARNLNESQKLKVVKAFDKAESAKEAKLVYESLSEAFVAPVKAGKTQLKESLGFASKPAGMAPGKALIVENNDWVARMQKLANIK